MLIITVNIFLAVLRNDITVVIVLHTVHDRTVYSLTKKLSKSIVGVGRGVGYGSIVNRIGLDNRGNTLLGIVAVGEGSAVRENDLADNLSDSRGLNLCLLLYHFRLEKSTKKLRTS